MPAAYTDVLEGLRHDPGRWAVTGVAGFIGSNLLEALLELGQSVVGLDDFSLGKRANLEDVQARVTPAAWRRFTFIEGDVRDLATCRDACRDAQYVLHQAAIGSVPRSIEDPLRSHGVNVSGHLNMLLAARDARVEHFVYASSSSVYGDHQALPKSEETVGRPLSPYAATKRACELYAEVAAHVYGLPSIGLRYFNVFGPRQDPEGAYAAVIPKWIAAMIRGEPVYINGSAETSRDFCHVTNVVQANILAACSREPQSLDQVYNVAVNQRTSLGELFELLRERLLPEYPHLAGTRPEQRAARPGDVAHSQADISKAQRLLGYRPSHTLRRGLDESLGWYKQALAP